MRRKTARELAALADGSLPPQRRQPLLRRASRSPKLARALARQRLAVQATRADATTAPPSLRTWVKRAVREARTPPRRPTR